MRAALALWLVVVSAAPASSHCYTFWHYTRPQNCEVRGTSSARARTELSGVGATKAPGPWYVEITKPPPGVVDERTPEQIADQAEHDAAVAAHKNEINFLMEVLHNQERATGQ